MASQNPSIIINIMIIIQTNHNNRHAFGYLCGHGVRKQEKTNRKRAGEKNGRKMKTRWGVATHVKEKTWSEGDQPSARDSAPLAPLNDNQTPKDTHPSKRGKTKTTQNETKIQKPRRQSVPCWPKLHPSKRREAKNASAAKPKTTKKPEA